MAKLLRIRQGIEEKYKNIGLEKFRLSIAIVPVTSRVESAINFRPELSAGMANPRLAKVISAAQSWNKNR